MLWYQSVIADTIAGTAGGVAKTICVYPLDIAATRAEVGASDTVGVVVDWRETHFRGLGIAVAAAPLYALLFHTAYVLSGTSTLGSLVASCVGVPAECAKHRVQLGASVRDAIRGGRSLYDGYIATLARNVPYNAVNFTAFFALNSILPAPLAGLLAGLLTALATHPLDLVTARVQTARLSSAQPPPTNMLRTLDDARTTNILFRGLTYRLFAFPPASALFFAIFHPTRTAVLGAFPQ